MHQHLKAMVIMLEPIDTFRLI